VCLNRASNTAIAWRPHTDTSALRCCLKSCYSFLAQRDDRIDRSSASATFRMASCVQFSALGAGGIFSGRRVMLLYAKTTTIATAMTAVIRFA